MGWVGTVGPFVVCLSAGAFARGSRDALWARVKNRVWGGFGGRDLLTKYGWSLRLQPEGREGG